MTFKFTADEAKTRARLKKLKEYMNSNVLKGKKFNCPHKRECKIAHEKRFGKKGIFAKGQLHHIGHKYDLRINNKPIRIMIVGQEFGAKRCPITFEQNYDEKIGDSKVEFMSKYKNNHMRGTVSALRLLFSKGLGTDKESEYLNFSNGKECCHIYDAFSLVNYLLCSAICKGSGMAGKSNSKMRKNCNHHFRNVLKILEPNIIIVQSMGFWNWIKKSFNDEPISKTKYLFEAQINGKKALVASFSHPSARNNKNWGSNDHTPYLLNTVKPTIKRILKEMKLN
jgi:uracil-DNA glycosylase